MILMHTDGERREDVLRGKHIQSLVRGGKGRKLKEERIQSSVNVGGRSYQERRQEVSGAEKS